MTEAQPVPNFSTTVRAARLGEAAAWDRLFDRFIPDVYAYAFAQVHDASVTEDIANWAFAVAVTTFEDCRGDSEKAVQAFFLGIVQRKLGDRDRGAAEAVPPPPAWVIDGVRSDMHAALASKLALPKRPSRAVRIRGWYMQRPSFALPILIAIVAIVFLLGREAPAGTPLHFVRLFKEELQVAIAGSHDVTTRLQLAERDLDEVGGSKDPQATVNDAARMHTDARPNLPTDHADPLNVRWITDQRRLATAEAALKIPLTVPPLPSPAPEPTPTRAQRP